MPLRISTGPVLVRCWQHRLNTGLVLRVLAHTDLFTGYIDYITCIGSSVHLFSNVAHFNEYIYHHHNNKLV